MRRIVLGLVCAVALGRADVVECENGDRYNGKVLLVDAQNVRLQNEITGTLTIPREKVASITFGAAGRRVPSAKTNAVPAGAAIEQVQNQFLSEATPEATQMYQEMVRDLLSGKLGVNDLRAKAQGTLKELNDLKSDLGDDDAAALLGSYAAILQNFVNAGAAAANTANPTNATSSPK
jgi:hypothetical protein